MSTASEQVPDDVLEELSFFLPGGSWDGGCERDYAQPTIDLVSGETAEPTQMIRVSTCGWREEETVKVVVLDPSGGVVYEAQEVPQDGFQDMRVSVDYYPDWDAPVGPYTFAFQGDSGAVEQIIQVVRPKEPWIYREDDQIVLRYFPPGERVRLLAYEPGLVHRFRAWQSFVVDSEGQLTIDLNMPSEDLVYVCIGDTVGRANSEFGGDVMLGRALRVSEHGETPVYECPDGDCAAVARLSPNTVVEVMERPYMQTADLSGGELWWPIGLGDGREGWIQDRFVEERLPSYDPSRTEGRSGTDSVTCPGAPPQQVQIGDRAQVCTKSDRVVVRASPGRGHAEVTRLEPGSYVDVIGGPECADNWSWWRIRASSGTTGWVAEGGDAVDPYFICPAE